MRLENQDQTTKTPIQSPSVEQLIVGQFQELSHENKTSASQGNPSPSNDHFAFVARATNDAIRDWDVKTGELSWPQGLRSLLGYGTKSTEAQINFWRNNLHPADRSRVSASINEALAGSDDHWNAE